MSNPGPTAQQRYDDFQRDAVNCVLKDFQKKINGRYLLVIPTGGGKDLLYRRQRPSTCLFEDGVLNLRQRTGSFGLLTSASSCWSKRRLRLKSSICSIRTLAVLRQMWISG